MKTTEIRGEAGRITSPEKTKAVFNSVCEYYGKIPLSVLGKSSKRDMVICRHVTAYILRYDYRMTWDDIGEFLARRDRTTAMHSVKTIKGWMETDKQLVDDISSIRELINSPATIDKIKTKYSGVLREENCGA